MENRNSLVQFWTVNVKDLLKFLNASLDGLSFAEANKRYLRQKSREKKQRPGWYEDLLLLASQFKSPLILLLVFAVLLSIVLREYSDSILMLIVVCISGLLGYYQERKASRAVQQLKNLVHSKASVIRSGKEIEILSDEVVHGDVVILNAGDIIPADGYILEAKDLHVNESALTGESFPVEKFKAGAGPLLPGTVTAVFKGTSVINGTANILAVHTGKETELGRIMGSLEKAVPRTAFENGVFQFGTLLLRLTLAFTGVILVLNIFFHRPFIESLLFSLALTVGLTPELLPAILTITQAAGAKRMAAKKMIVKKLNAIQNLGEIDVLCSDKTGTITQGVVTLEKAVDIHGKENERLLLYGYLNAYFETGFFNPIDEAIRNVRPVDISGFTKCDEVPYDFIRKRLSIVVRYGRQHLMITKGAVPNVLDVCNKVEYGSSITGISDELRLQISKEFEKWSYEGFRLLAISYKDVSDDPVIDKNDEDAMIFLGFLILADPLKPGILASIENLQKQGISLKIITGDNRFVASHVAKMVQLKTDRILTGSGLEGFSEERLQKEIGEIEVFAEILPVQKERIIQAFRKAGHTVGYMGDGINDANALKAADVGISIDNAVDVAKEAADLVLLDKDINVIKDGVEEGRRTFMNTLKYILVTMSANFGNMFSMAIAALIFPFFPLLPVQILLNNFLSDLPAIAIASDTVDEELIRGPRKWSIPYIRKFMVVFGLQSSVFDFATFGLLYHIFGTRVEEFRTGWFMESLLTEIGILLIIRTARPFFKSRPSRYLLMATIFSFVACLLIPYLPIASLFELKPLPLIALAYILAIVFLYMVMAELSKRFLIRHL